MEIFLRSFISGCRNARQGLLIKKTAVILRPFLTQTAISLRWHCLKICFLFLLGVQILWEDGGKYSEISNVLHGEHYSENSFGEIRGGDQLWLKEIRKVLCYVQTTPLNFFLSFFNIAIVGSNSARWNYAIIQHGWEASKIAGNNTGIYNFPTTSSIYMNAKHMKNLSFREINKLPFNTGKRQRSKFPTKQDLSRAAYRSP
jgi:hypothetical protein